MESTDETYPRIISEASISMLLPSPNLEPDELPNKIMEDLQKLDEHNESICETEDLILQIIYCLEKPVPILPNKFVYFLS